jgi:hypothetical protein
VLPKGFAWPGLLQVLQRANAGSNLLYFSSTPVGVPRFAYFTRKNPYNSLLKPVFALLMRLSQMSSFNAMIFCDSR